jgi:hypothetical protein
MARRPARELRIAIDCLPLQTRRAMLDGIDSNQIIVGAYTDRKGGVCPMLAAHRNGGRTSYISVARAWDRYTGAKRPRLATRREVRTLRSLLESSLVEDLGEGGSIAQAAAQIRAELAELAAREPSCAEPERPAIPEPAEAPIRIRRLRRPWPRPARRYEDAPDLLAAAEAQLTEQETVGP